MTKFEILPTIPFKKAHVAHPLTPPEVVHLEDPALSVMTDFRQTKPPVTTPDTPIDDALNEMKISGVHLMLVIDDTENVIGLISSEDILGEKPIKLIQERRISRDNILVKMVMIPAEALVAFDIETLKIARVGSIINTLKESRLQHALVVRCESSDHKSLVRGLISMSQISKQLHMDVRNSIRQAETIAELQKRHS